MDHEKAIKESAEHMAQAVQELLGPLKRKVALLQKRLDNMVGTHDEVLRNLDPKRSYPKGTVAHHDGGLIRARWTTSPLEKGTLFWAGWEVLVAGVASISIEVDSERRVFEVRRKFTGGEEELSLHKFESMAYAGVYKRGESYHNGDIVTFDGSGWVCTETGTKEVPGTGTGFKLFVKRGRDAKGAIKPVKISRPVRVSS